MLSRNGSVVIPAIQSKLTLTELNFLMEHHHPTALTMEYIILYIVLCQL